MASKVPDSIHKENLGSARLLICPFITSDIDDNDTWASGLTSVIGYWWVGVGDNSYDVSITSVDTAGLFTFDSAGNMTGNLYVLCKDM